MVILDRKKCNFGPNICRVLSYIGADVRACSNKGFAIGEIRFCNRKY